MARGLDGPAPIDPAIAEALVRWVATGLLSPEQADAIRRSEAAGSAHPPTTPRLPPLAEVLGYIGAMVAVAAAATLFGLGNVHLSDGGQLAVAGAITGALLLAGRLLRDSPQPAFSRLAGVLWLLSTAGVFWLASALAGWGPGPTSTAAKLAAAVATAAYAVALWLLRRRSAQVFGLWGATVILLWAGLSAADRSPGVTGLWVCAAGIAWFVAARTAVVRPADLTYALGGLLLIAAPWFAPGSSKYVLAAAVGVLLMSLSAPLRQNALLVLGAIETFAAVIGWVVDDLGGGAGAAGALLIVGLVLVAAAVVVARVLGRRGRSGPSPPD